MCCHPSSHEAILKQRSPHPRGILLAGGQVACHIPCILIKKEREKGGMCLETDMSPAGMLNLLALSAKAATLTTKV